MKAQILTTAYKFYQLFFAKKIFYKLNKLVYNFALRGLGILNYESNKISGEESFIKNYITKMDNGIIFDIGANIGDYAKSLRKSNQAVDIYAFEPHPVTFKNLLINTRDLNIKTFNVAIGSKKDTLYLYDYADQDGSSHASLYKEVIETIHKSTAIQHEVNSITLTSFVKEHNIERVNLLKIDTEGHELEVLRGFELFIREQRVDLIHFEFNEMNIASRVFFKDFWEFLPNYDLYRMLPDDLVPIKTYNPVFCEIFAYQNIVAILKENYQDLEGF
jgi:FkbM family methyltransferase